MLKILLAAVVGFSLAALDSAAAKRKRQKARAVPAVTMPAKPLARTPGPAWAGPNECFTDEGYGRYWPCGAGKDD